MKGKLIVGALLVAVCLGLLVAKVISQPPSQNDKATTQLISQPPPAGSPPNPVSVLPASNTPAPAVQVPIPPADGSNLVGSTQRNATTIPITPIPGSNPPPLASAIINQAAPPAQELTFEQVLSELRRNRDAQKRLREQEQDLIGTLRRKADEKHKDWQNAETKLREVEGRTARTATTSIETGEPRTEPIPPANNRSATQRGRTTITPIQTVEPPQRR